MEDQPASGRLFARGRAGGPARLIVPQLYAWKSAKWLAGIEIMDRKGRLTIGLQATSLPHYSMLTI
jgi:DMSO/TMAO reductase YedYZ molybdopterin-dependent catalytic subunit